MAKKQKAKTKISTVARGPESGQTRQNDSMTLLLLFFDPR